MTHSLLSPKDKRIFGYNFKYRCMIIAFQNTCRYLTMCDVIVTLLNNLIWTLAWPVLLFIKVVAVVIIAGVVYTRIWPT